MLRPDSEYLKTLLILDVDGVLWWKPRVDSNGFNERFAGEPAGTLDPNGYIYVQINGKRHAAHRIIWAMLYGYWPDTIDHIDGVKSNNRSENLREATQAQQCQNRVKGLNKSSKYLGVSARKNGKWLSQIRINRVLHRIGLFDTEEEAYDAYLKAKEKLHPFQSTVRSA